MSEIRADKLHNVTGDNDSGIDLSTNDQVVIKTADTTSVTVDSSQRVNIGTGTPPTADSVLTVQKSSAANEFNVISSPSHASVINLGDTDDYNICRIKADNSNNSLQFQTNNSERMRIDNSGHVLFSTTGSPDSVANASSTSATGAAYEAEGFIAVARAGLPLIVNRVDSDGDCIFIKQEGSAEGSISVSGSTVSYNAFSGSHWSRLADNSKPTILKGTVIETIDEMCDWYQITFTVPATDEQEEYTFKISHALQDGQSVGDTITYNYNGTDYQATIIKEADNKHPKCKISDTADSTRVYGVFADWDNDDDTVNDMYVTAVGTHVVRVHSSATVSAGDLLTSNGDGTAKVQDDDIIRSKTIGKVLTNIKQETYSDGSYTVPCALYCG